ncbi:uncharacterized protein V1516DRAFT_125568 [Lipomyces oligophaga]|uniref:uncharacterized protein n=1 Tax=Lipomyces oligophaga TaxID=45792 RepID=UPI0034CFF55B
MICAGPLTTLAHSLTRSLSRSPVLAEIFRRAVGISKSSHLLSLILPALAQHAVPIAALISPRPAVAFLLFFSWPFCSPYVSVSLCVCLCLSVSFLCLCLSGCLCIDDSVLPRTCAAVTMYRLRVPDPAPPSVVIACHCLSFLYGRYSPALLPLPKLLQPLSPISFQSLASDLKLHFHHFLPRSISSSSAPVAAEIADMVFKFCWLSSCSCDCPAL